jgi:hypothetical protein
VPKSELAGNPGPLGIYSDEAKRISDSYNLHASVISNHGLWLAVRIQDGIVYDAMSHETVFDTREDAVRTIGQFSDLYFYIRILGTGMNCEAAQVMLNYNRNLYSIGARMPAPNPHTMPTIPGRRWETML